MSLHVLTALTFSQTGFSLVAFLIFITSKKNQAEMLWLGIAMILAVVADISAYTIFFTGGTANNVPSNVYTVVYTLLLLLFYRDKISIKGFETIAPVLVVIFVILAVLNFIFLEKILVVSSNPRLVLSLTAMSLSLTYFYLLIRDLPAKSITILPMFWINAGLLLFNAGSFILYLFVDYLINTLHNQMINFWLFEVALSMVFYLMVCVGFWLNRSPSLKESLA